MPEYNPEMAASALKSSAIQIEEKLLALLPNPEGMEERVIDAMRYALLAGGKRLRPFLVIQSASLFDVAEETALRVAAAAECVHTYSLIHDDLPAMDDDDMRRGKPSVHKQYDEATAILAGDALLTLAFEILADEKTHTDPQVRLSLISELSKAIGALGMVGGQMIDLEAENQNLNNDQITRMQQMKTGALIVFSCHAGAILANITDARYQLLGNYAHDIGLAFQVVDDLLDIEGSSHEIGKTAGKDIAAGKATLISTMGINEARKFANNLVESAITNLQVFDNRADVLRSLAHFVTKRAH